MLQELAIVSCMFYVHTGNHGNWALLL